MNIATLVENDYLYVYIKYLRSNINDITAIVLWALSNIVGEMGEYRDIILGSSLFDIVVELSVTTNSNLRNNIAAFFLNSLRDNDTISNNQVYEITKILMDYIYTTNDNLSYDCLESLSIISDRQINVTAIFIDSELIKRIIAFDFQAHPEYISPVIKIIGNILFEGDEVVQYMCDLNILDFLMNFFEIKSRRIKKDLLWTLANFAGGSKYHCKILADAKITRKVFKVASGHDIDLKREALFVIQNISDSKALSVNIELTKYGVFSLIIDILRNLSDSETIWSGLIILENLFESAYQISKINHNNTMARKFEEICGLSSLEGLLNHYNHNIYKKAEFLIQTYYKEKYI
jgi:hypothetical protein